MVNNSEADWFHLDVMDGIFVPNISYGIPIIRSINKYAEKPLDVHLMIKNPERYIEKFAEVGSNIISVHYEATVHLHRTLNQIENTGCKAGVVLNLTTPVSVLEDILDKCYMVLLMSINREVVKNLYLNISYRYVNWENAGSRFNSSSSELIIEDGIDLAKQSLGFGLRYHY